MVCTHTCEQRQRDVDGCLTVGPGEPKGTQTAVRSSGGGRHTSASEETGIRNTSGSCAKLTSKSLVRKRRECQCDRNASNNSLQPLLDRFCLNPRIQLRVDNTYLMYSSFNTCVCLYIRTSTHKCTLCIRTCTYAHTHTTQTHTLYRATVHWVALLVVSKRLMCTCHLTTCHRSPLPCQPTSVQLQVYPFVSAESSTHSAPLEQREKRQMVPSQLAMFTPPVYWLSALVRPSSSNPCTQPVKPVQKERVRLSICI